MTVLVYGCAVATGTPQEIRDHPGVREAYLGEQEIGMSAPGRPKVEYRKAQPEGTR